MDSVKEYALSIIACSLFCGIMSCLVSGSYRKRIIQVVSGTALAITVLLPLVRIDLYDCDYSAFWDRFQYSAQDYVDIGVTAAQEEKGRYIKDACAAYISSKAAALGADVVAEVYLSEELLPVTAVIHGKTGHKSEPELIRIVELDLGITKENQVWNWNQEDNSS